MKIYCLYGYGKQTEVSLPRPKRIALLTAQRSYWYMQGEYEHDETRSEAENAEAIVSDPASA